ncbi:MAG: Hsp33 family molecular chaperone HslO [Oscillospiraceae bacterium]|nr:Hsp33 family molecular chaperone HslO [Oscillospiraceae bacterium]
MDRIIRATAGEGAVKMCVINARDCVEEARRIHRCSPTAAAALGRTLCAASMLGQAMKEEEASLTIRINGGGPLGSVVAVSDKNGFVRGYVDRPEVDLPLRADGKLDVGGAVGRDGTLTVSRDIGLKEPYIGSVELVSGEIAEDVTSYLLTSEQLPSACALGVLIDTDRTVKAAGGFLVQLMPGAPEETVDRLEENIFMMDQLTTVLAEDGEEALFDQVLRGFEHHIVGEAPIAYHCPCSRERVEKALGVISPEELEEMIAEGRETVVSCQFCEKDYAFSPDELRSLLENRRNETEK